MATMIIRSTVADYPAWRPVYDAHEPTRNAAGITNGRVFRRAEDPNEIAILFDVADLAKARAFTVSEDLKSTMQKAGVTGIPTFYFVD